MATFGSARRRLYGVSRTLIGDSCKSLPGRLAHRDASACSVIVSVLPMD
jgi:hypothetical protein